MRNDYGPTLMVSQNIHATKYRLAGESFYEAICRMAAAMADSDDHRKRLKELFLDMRFMPAGRVQCAMGAPRQVTAFNCFVSGRIEDSMTSIMQRATEAAETMRRGGGIGYDFSRLRPRGDLIKTLDSRASGPISFMQIFDAVCQTIACAGHRRGAQMGVLRVDHPDIEEFVAAKQNSTALTGFNISVGVTDRFMRAVKEGTNFDLTFEGRTYRSIDARALWDKIMRSTWDWAEPGVLFLDRINSQNNLYYCEKIEATNPCGEQPLPPYGACLLGSFNLVKYVEDTNFNWNKLVTDIPNVVRAMDNVIDRTIYPLPEQEVEAKAKRRMGLGVTGLANAAERLGYPYASVEFLDFMDKILKIICVESYRASALLAAEKGPFPFFERESYLAGAFVAKLPLDVRNLIAKHGIRNSHLTSIAPTGTISLCADNVSSGIEPVFSHFYDRTIQTFDGPIVERVEDYAYRTWGLLGRTANSISAKEHVEVVARAQHWVDSGISKTCNVGPEVSFKDFKELYMMAWERGCKGLTTFRPNGKRFGVLNEVAEAVKQEPTVVACFIDPKTGTKSCDS